MKKELNKAKKKFIKKYEGLEVELAFSEWNQFFLGDIQEDLNDYFQIATEESEWEHEYHSFGNKVDYFNNNASVTVEYEKLEEKDDDTAKIRIKYVTFTE